MSVQKLRERIRTESAESAAASWREFREVIHDAADEATTEEERVFILAAHKSVMDLVQTSMVQKESLPAFLEARRQDYNLLLIKECKVGEDASVEAFDYVTKREIAAGRMAADDEMRKLVEAQLLRSYMTHAQLIEKWKSPPKPTPEVKGWRKWFKW